MDLRDSKARLILIVLALGVALVIAVASCGGGDDASTANEVSGATTGQSEAGDQGGGDVGGAEDDGQPAAKPEQVLAEVTGEEEITLTITNARRESGGFLTVEGTIHNGGDGIWFDSGWAGPERELAENGFSMAGASIVAPEAGKRYLILRDTNGRCLCTGFGNGIDEDATISWFAQFPEPGPASNEVQFQIGNMPVATIPVQ